MKPENKASGITGRTIPPFDQWFVEKNGAMLLPTFFDIEKDVQALDVKPGDVWIVSIPKSGTTWMQEMVWLLTHNLDFEGAKTLLKYRSPGLEDCYIYKFFRAFDRHVPLTEFERLAALSGGRRVLKTHLQYDCLPDKLREPDSPAKIIFVVRNPKDACVSYYYYHSLYSKSSRTPINMDDFCENFMKGKYITGPFWRQVKYFWNHRNDPNIMFVKYEDMKKDLKNVVKEVATFLEEPIPNEEQMKQLLHHLSFESMQNNPAVNRERGEGALRINHLSENGRFIRKGIVGDSKEKLTPELLKKFDEWIEENTREIELRFEDSL